MPNRCKARRLASIDLLLSLKTIDEVLEFIERRVQVLYAGSLAESLVRKKIHDDVANKLLMSTAANDFAKVRELVRIWVGLKHPEVTESKFQEKLRELPRSVVELRRLRGFWLGCEAAVAHLRIALTWMSMRGSSCIACGCRR